MIFHSFVVNQTHLESLDIISTVPLSLVELYLHIQEKKNLFMMMVWSLILSRINTGEYSLTHSLTHSLTQLSSSVLWLSIFLSNLPNISVGLIIWPTEYIGWFIYLTYRIYRLVCLSDLPNVSVGLSIWPTEYIGWFIYLTYRIYRLVYLSDLPNISVGLSRLPREKMFNNITIIKRDRGEGVEREQPKEYREKRKEEKGEEE